MHKAPANEVVRGITGLTPRPQQGRARHPQPEPGQHQRHPRLPPREPGDPGLGRALHHSRQRLQIRPRPPAADLPREVDRARAAMGGVRAQRRARCGRGSGAAIAQLPDRRLARRARSRGPSPSRRFFVSCDRTTMTQTDIDNGRLICVIGVAPVKPAEFVIIRIGLMTAHGRGLSQPPRGADHMAHRCTRNDPYRGFNFRAGDRRPDRRRLHAR